MFGTCTCTYIRIYLPLYENDLTRFISNRKTEFKPYNSFKQKMKSLRDAIITYKYINRLSALCREAFIVTDFTADK